MIDNQVVIKNYYMKLKSTVKELIETYPTLTEYEALRIAIELDRNSIIEDAFGVTTSNSTPKFLEDIAMSLRNGL